MLSGREEEMVETEEEEDEEPPGGGGSPTSYSSPPSPPGPQKRPLSSTSSHSSPPPDPFRKKTRDLPNIYNCHSCGLRFPDKGRSERLQTLDSQWRIVLLCGACRRAIRSAEVCSYCFASFAEESEGSVSCRRCSARVHHGCLPKQRGYLAASDLDPDLFVCVDCCVFPTSPIRKPCYNFRDSCATRASSVSLEDVVRSAKCAAVKKLELAARAKDKALAKAMVAKRAADRARSALDLVVVAEKKPLACTHAAVTDEKLALQLHRAMNGSHRISRNSCPGGSDFSIGIKRGQLDTNLVCKDSESGSSNFYGKVELCMEDTLDETMGIIDAKLLNVIGSAEENCLVRTGVREGMDQNKEANKSGEGIPEEVPAPEEQGSCSVMLVNSTGDDNSVDSVSAPCRSCNWPSTSLSTFQQDEKCNTPDRYLKKYCKRSSRIKDKKENGGSASLLVPVSQ